VFQPRQIDTTEVRLDPSEEQDDWVLRVLGIATADSLACRDMMTSIDEDLPSVRTLDPEAASTIRALLDAAKELTQTSDYGRAIVLLSNATDLIARAKSAARVRQATTEIPENIVAETKARLIEARSVWNGALAAARERAADVVHALDEDSSDHADGLRRLLRSYWTDLSDILAVAMTSRSSAGLAKQVSVILATVRDLRAEISDDEVLSELEGQGVSARAPFLAALEAIEVEVNGLGAN
jgi:hypothetical protein